MPAAVVKGILISIGIIAALGLAVYENPEVQQWLDEQRRKLAVLLRNLGDELDPQSRREAEAFAYGGQTPRDTSDELPADDAAVTTGRSMASAAIRRIPVQGTVDQHEREERQRLGREYLARRNQQMMEMQERRQAQSPTMSASVESLDRTIKDEEPLLESAMESEFFDTMPIRDGTPEDPPLVDPFTDEHLIDRSETPRPVVPPKIKLEHIDPTPEPDVAGPSNVLVDQHRFPVPGSMPEEELSYEDQLALALAISKDESSAARQMSHADSFANDLRLATEASLKQAQPHDLSQSHLTDASEEDLYNVTPHLTRATLATLEAQHPSLTPEPVRDELVPAGVKTPTEASSFAFESAASSASIAKVKANSQTASEASLIDVEDAASDVISEDGIATPDSWTEVGSQEGDSEREAALA